MQCLNVYNLKFIYVQKCAMHISLVGGYNVSMHMVIRYASKQCINDYHIHSWPIIAVLMTFEAKKSMNLFSNLGCPILHALNINKQYSQTTTTVSVVHPDVVVLHKPNIFHFRSF